MGNLVEVGRFVDPEEAYVASALLNARGIRTVMQNEHHLTMAPYLRVGLGGYRILCFDSQFDEARRELKVAEEFQSDESIGEPDSAGRARKTNWFCFPIAFSFGVPFLLRYRRNWEFAAQLVIILALLAAIFWFWIF